MVNAQGSLRFLSFGTEEIQSCVDLREPWILRLAYTRWMVSALLLHPDPRRFLVFGLGGGGLPHFLLHHYPDSSIDVVEKEALVIHLARSHFYLPEREGLRLINQDAASFLQQDDHLSYHLIFLDIFGPDSMAPDLFQPDFYRTILGKLSPCGILSVNVWCDDTTLFRQALNAARTASEGALLAMRVKKRGNMVLLLFPGEIPWQIVRGLKKAKYQQLQRYGIDFTDCFRAVRRRRLVPFLFP